MSKIEVDAIDKQSGSTLTLGGSGTAVTLACGATQTGFGRTGTVDWQTSIKTTTFSAVNGEGYFVNTTSGAVTVNLPVGSVGAIVAVKDYAQTFDTANCTISANGSEKIENITADLVLSTEGVAVTLVYADATRGWQAVNSNEITNTQKFITATGGTITTVCTNFKVHTFTGPGTFCVSCAGNAGGSNTVDYLVIAGGGGGGGDQQNGYGSGGGGAGGYRESNGTASGSYTIGLPANSPVAALPVTVQGYPIGVGGGGAAGCSGPSAPSVTNGVRGVNSTFSCITSTGGGGGAYGGSPAPAFSVVPGGVGPGGSGGGGAGPAPTTTGVGTGNTPSVTPAQGSNGGNARNPSTPKYGGGGGGGASAVGENFYDAIPGNTAGDGGAGATSSINGTPTARGGGGGAGSYNSVPNGWNTEDGAGGTGGGGHGGQVIPGNSHDAAAGTANTGGGGGGAASNHPSSPGRVNAGQGGSGIVIIRYKFQ